MWPSWSQSDYPLHMKDDCLVFRKKDLYLIITQKLKVKCGAFHMKCGAFREMRRFSWKVALFIWNAALFVKCSAFREKRCFLWNAVLFMKSGAFHMKYGTFREKRCFSYEKHLKSLKTADSTQISHLDLVFHRVQREGHSWKAPLFERPLARNCNPMFPHLTTHTFFYWFLNRKTLPIPTENCKWHDHTLGYRSYAIQLKMHAIKC